MTEQNPLATEVGSKGSVLAEPCNSHLNPWSTGIF